MADREMMPARVGASGAVRGVLTVGETKWQLLVGATNRSATSTQHRPKPSSISSSVL
jgi:hypothetical protein